MKLTLNQTKFLGLIMKLELRAKEYNKLCEKLDTLKKKNIDENAPELLDLKEMFEAIDLSITEINRQLKKLKDDEDLRQKLLLEKYDPSNIFKKN